MSSGAWWLQYHVFEDVKNLVEAFELKYTYTNIYLDHHTASPEPYPQLTKKNFLKWWNLSSKLAFWVVYFC